MNALNYKQVRFSINASICGCGVRNPFSVRVRCDVLFRPGSTGAPNTCWTEPYTTTTVVWLDRTHKERRARVTRPIYLDRGEGKRYERRDLGGAVALTINRSCARRVRRSIACWCNMQGIASVLTWTCPACTCGNSPPTYGTCTWRK